MTDEYQAPEWCCSEETTMTDEYRPPSYYEIQQVGEFQTERGGRYCELIDDQEEAPIRIFYSLLKEVPTGGVDTVNDYPTLLEACLAYTELTGHVLYPDEDKLPFLNLPVRPEEECSRSTSKDSPNWKAVKRQRS